MKKRLTPHLTCIALGLAAFPTAAEETRTLKEVTVTASSDALEEQQASVTQKTIIDRAEIEALGGLTSEEHTKIVVDFEKLNYLGSSGLEVILSKIQGLRNRGGDIVLARTAPKIYKVFDLLGLTDFLKFFGSLDEAVSSF